MNLKDIYEQLENLADAAGDNPEDDPQLIALVLLTLVGALLGGNLRSFAHYVARWANEALMSEDAGLN